MPTTMPTRWDIDVHGVFEGPPLTKSELLSRNVGHRWGQTLKLFPRGPIYTLVSDALIGIDLWGSRAEPRVLETYRRDPEVLAHLTLSGWLELYRLHRTLLEGRAAWFPRAAYTTGPVYRPLAEARATLAHRLYTLEALLQDTDTPDPLETWQQSLEELEKSMPIRGPLTTTPLEAAQQARDTLPGQFAPWEEERDYTYTLLVDLVCALKVHGAELDEKALAIEDPAEALVGYLEMYRDYLAGLQDLEARVRTEEEMRYGVRLAWRVWQMLRRSNTPYAALPGLISRLGGAG